MTAIPKGQEPWVGVHVYFDEVGNSFNDPTQHVFAFGGLVFASDAHRMSVLSAAAAKRLIGPGARNPRGSDLAAEESVISDVLDLLNPGGSSTLSEDKVIVSISHVDLRNQHVRDIIDHGKQSAIGKGVAYLLPKLSGVSGKNWLWVSSALMALSNTVCRVVAGNGQFLAELHVTFDERRLDHFTRGVMKRVIEKRFIGKAPIDGIRALITESQWTALERRVDIRTLRVRSASDENEGALQLAHWLARAAFRGLNSPENPVQPRWIERIVKEHGANAIRDITNQLV